VDRCQLLGARMITGGRKIEEALREKVLGPHVFLEAAAFSARVAREVRERRAAFGPSADGSVHLKKVRGGLREIDLALAAEKARLAAWEAVEDDPFGSLARRDPSRRTAYEALAAANDFLVAVRSACRVSIAAVDEIHRDHLARPARILGYGAAPDPAVALLTDLERHTAAAARAVEELLPGVV